MKRLSIIIPTYNMATLLPRCLGSLVQADGADEWLEAIVVNDGSKDESLAVAKEWEGKYPQIITIIDKPNGNYGSTINAALPIAKGEYIKVLDSDDWFDTKVLSQFLKMLGEKEADIWWTHFSQIGAKNTEVIRYNTMGREPYEYGRVYDLDAVLKDGYIRFFLMHGLTYRTDMLRQMGYKQTEGISYTDTEWSCYPMFMAKTIVFCDLNLYQYNLDREGQTMDPKVLLKSVGQLQKVTDQMLEFYRIHKNDLSEIRRKWMKQYFENRLRILYKIYLLDMPRDVFQPVELVTMDEKYRPIMEELKLNPKLYPENKLIRLEYFAYWRKHKHRPSVCFERINHIVDIVVKWAYVKFIRK